MVTMMKNYQTHTGSSSTKDVLSIALSDLSDNHIEKIATLSRRQGAKTMRSEIEDHIAHGGFVELDCSGTDATQSFMDELVGILVLERGPSVLDLLRFRGCTKDMKAIINFVVSDRAIQYAKNPHHHAPR